MCVKLPLSQGCLVVTAESARPSFAPPIVALMVRRVSGFYVVEEFIELEKKAA